MPVDWSLLGPPPDIGGAIRQGMEYGRAMRQRGAQESAFAALAQNPDDPKALASLAATGPDGMKTAWAFQDRARENRQRDLRRSVFAPARAPQPSAFAPIAPSAPAGAPSGVETAPLAPAATQPMAPAASPARSTSGYDPEALRQLWAEDPDSAKQIMSYLQGQDKLTRDALAAKYAAAAPVYLELMRVPQEQRQAVLQSAAPYLAQSGFTPQELAAVQLDDRSLRLYGAIGAGIERYRTVMAPEKYGEGQTAIDPFTNDPLFRTPKQGTTRVGYDAEGREFTYSTAGDPGFGLGDVPGFTAPTLSGAGAPATANGFDAIYEGFVKPQEGGYNASDGRSGAPVNFGINQRANPDIDVAKLTPESAKQVLHDRYWTPSGADRLSGPLQAIHFDTAVNMGVEAAKNLLEQSGGDASRYMDLREARHRSLGGNEQGAWASRNAKLRSFAGLGAAAPPAQGGRGYTGGTRPGGKARTPSETRAYQGKTYYKIEGRWYDNPEGK